MSRTFAHPALVGTGMLLACVAASCRAEPVEQSTPPPPETVTVTAGAPNPPSATSTPPTTPRTESRTRLLDNSVTIAEVVDGDTVRYSVGPRSVTARLIGIDAPTRLQKLLRPDAVRSGDAIDGGERAVPRATADPRA